MYANCRAGCPAMACMLLAQRPPTTSLMPPAFPLVQAEAKLDKLKNDNTSAMIQHAQALMDLDSMRRTLLANQALQLAQALQLPWASVNEVAGAEKVQALDAAVENETQRRSTLTRHADKEREEVRHTGYGGGGGGEGAWLSFHGACLIAAAPPPQKKKMSTSC